jgi:hypothetical protein
MAVPDNMAKFGFLQGDNCSPILSYHVSNHFSLCCVI